MSGDASTAMTNASAPPATAMTAVRNTIPRAGRSSPRGSASGALVAIEHHLSRDGLAHEQHRDERGEGTDDEQGHDVDVDPPPRARGRGTEPEVLPGDGDLTVADPAASLANVF